ncbi:hypothetical protein KP509_24G057900 [Ceratopteris richardii]|uniref:PNPLA domain-containing protein n=1 Tax=Ceratopteris richardii TaxID=49495 RepID=A0A8T2RWW2_CERRI|nr:hypothetical protein KP509_24G057900 [Ceratopteris richardii]
MESSDDAAVGLFAIGPSTALGRAIALRLLVCESIKEIRTDFLVRLRRVGKVLWTAYQMYGLRLFKVLLLPFNPRNPHILLTIVVGSALLLRRSRMVRLKAESAYRRNFWKNVMKSARTYDEWAHAANTVDKECVRRKDSDLYDEDLVRTKLHELQMRRKEGIVQDILFCLRTDLVRNLGNMCNRELHMGRLQVPKLIQDYIDEVRYHLKAVCDSDYDDLPLDEKLAFIRETRHAFGRTALLLSGGASLGAFHVGVVRTLMEHHLLPRIVAGASVGSIICAVIATRTWTELQSFFGDNMPTLQFFDQLGGIFTIVSRLFTRGAVHDIRRLQHMLRELTQNMTFQEAYDITGRVLGISVCSPRKHEPPRCLNYLTSPHVVIWSAVTASCAFPGLFEAQELMAKDRHGQLIPYHNPVQVTREEQGLGTRHWRDGSLESDLPMVQLKELFNVNHFIVSQANPHIAPILRMKDIIRAYGGDFAAKLAHLAEMEVKHRCSQVWKLGFPMGGVAKLFAQDWEGDVTIVMPATLAQFAKIIQNPTPLELQKAVNQGRRCTWEKLSAINANCGIELMLDQCVSELNRRRKMKRSLERNSMQMSGTTTRSSGAKRIPSWNCIARESSWGSLDEEAIAESLNAAGGPWGGPTIRTLKNARNNYDGSDSETESMDLSHYSWTRAGGPLMRTASASQFVQEQAAELHFYLNRDDARSHDSSDETEILHPALMSPNAQAPIKEVCTSNRLGNKIFDKNLCVLQLKSRKFEDSDGEDHEQSVHSAIPSPNTENLFSGFDDKCGIHCVLQPSGGIALSVAEASLRETIMSSGQSEIEGSNRPYKSIEYGAFGSFIRKADVDDYQDE